MEKLIARLIRAREEKNITLQDISYKTNIRLEILARLESGDTSFQPMPYIRAILRKYAETVGMKLQPSDFEEFIEKPTSEIPKEERSSHQPVISEPMSVASPSMPVGFENSQTEQSHMRRLIYASLAGMLIVALFVVWYFARQTEKISETQPHRVSEQQAEQQVLTKMQSAPVQVKQDSKPEQVVSATVEVQRKPVIEETKPTAQSEKKHELIVRSKTDTCWISVASDKNNAKEMLLTPSAVAKFNADSLFTLTVGKLESAELWLNGKPVTLPRRSGAISGFKLMPPKD